MGRLKPEMPKELFEWRREMVEKYGDGITAKPSALPPEEIKRGAKILLEYIDAKKTARKKNKSTWRH